MMVPKAEHIAIIGASSQIGQALLPRLAGQGYQTYRVGREDRSLKHGVTTFVFDEKTQSFSPHIAHIDSVISLAPLPTIEVVVKMAKSLGARRIIAFGSTGRFSKVGSTSSIEQEFVLQQEHAEALFSNQCELLDIGWTLFRPTMIYGAGADQNVAFIQSIIRRFGLFPMPFGANGRRQPVHVDDLAAACVLALGTEATINKAYNLAGGEIISFSEMVSRIFDSENRKPIILPIPKVLFLLLIQIARRLPTTAFVRREMVDRMYQDLVANNYDAIHDFGYSPQSFRLKS